jgi:hypothetical protein
MRPALEVSGFRPFGISDLFRISSFGFRIWLEPALASHVPPELRDLVDELAPRLNAYLNSIGRFGNEEDPT